MKYSALFGSSVKCFIQPFTAVDLMGGELAQVDPGVKGGAGGWVGLVGGGALLY